MTMTRTLQSNNLCNKDVEKKEEECLVVKHVTDIVGEWGVWQSNLSMLIFLQGIVMGWNSMGFSFHAFKVDFWCDDVPIDYQNKTDLMKCYKFKNASEKCTSWRYDTSMMEVTITSEFDLVCDRSYLASLTQSVYFIGYMLAGTIGAYLSDRYGRRKLSVIASIMEIIATLSCAFSFNFTQYLVSRFFLAFATITRRQTLWTLLFECIGPKYRPDVTLVVGLGWVVGYITVPLLAYLLPNFRHLILMNLIPFVILIIWFNFFNESPRWELIKGRYESAEVTIRKALVMNGKSVEGLSEKMNQLKQHIDSLIKEEDQSKKPNVLDLFRTPNLRRNTLIACYSAIVLILIYYGISYNIGDFGGNYYVNFMLGGLVEAPGQIACIYGFRYVSRKQLSIIILIVAVISSLFTIINIPLLRIMSALVCKCSVSVMYWIIFILAAEIYPTELRATGSGLVQVVARIGAIIAPFIKDINVLTSHAFVMSLYAILSIINVFLITFLPETKGMEVPDTLMEAENIGTKDKKSNGKKKNDELE